MENKLCGIIIFTILIFVILLMTNNSELQENYQNKKQRIYDYQDFTAYRQRINEEVKKKELNRDFNYESPLFYKTPFQFLDFRKCC